MAKADLVKFLLDNEVQLSSCCKTDPKQLSEKLFQKCVISDCNFFKSLDHSRVDPQLQVRYLIRLVSMRVSEDESVWEKLVALLTGLGESQMCVCLSKYTDIDNEDVDVWHDCVSEFTSTSDNGEGSDYLGLNEPSSKDDINFLDTPLCADDTSWILNILVQASHKWELIARTLNLPTYEINNCRRIDNKLSLDNVISFWLSSTPSKPTMNTLLTALKSRLVEEKRVAQELEDIFLQNKMITIKSDTTASCLSIIYQSSNVEVADGKSTLLQVQATTTESVVFYQWKKDGQPLANSVTHYGVNEDILVVSHASQGAEGEYTCDVSCTHSTRCSNKITLTVLYSPAKKRLLDLYSIHKEIPLDSWPPVGTKSFINLTVVQSIRDQNISGHADKDLETRVKVDYSEVFGEYKSGTLIVTEGRPGSGKTTLARKIIKDWCKGISLMKAKFVFIITLRTMNRNTAQETLSIILKLLYRNPEELRVVCEEIEVANGEGVCFIIDGLDEYHPQDRDNSLIYQLLDKTYLPLAMVIVMSRPVALETLTEEAVTLEIEVLGFNKEQILEYIENFPFSNSSSDSQIAATYSDELKEYLYMHPTVFNMCYLPFHAAMICFLFKYQKGDIPNTQTKVYQEFTRSIILRHLKRKNSKTQVHSLKELSGNTRDNFNKLCLLAYKMTVNKKQIATPDILVEELYEHASSNSDEWCLGLVTINHIAELFGVTDTYSFLHLTIQEFLAAYYITSLEPDKQLELFPGLPGMSSQVTMFYFGQFQFPSCEGFEIGQLQMTFFDWFTVLLHCAFESQQPTVCDEVGEYCGDTYELVYNAPSDLAAIKYVMLNTSRPILGITIQPFSYDSFDVTNLLQHLSRQTFHYLSTLVIHKYLNDVETLALSEILKSCCSLVQAILSFHEINYDSAKAFADTFQYLACLEALHISYHPASGEFSKLLSKSNSLTNTDLAPSFDDIDSSEVQELGSLGSGLLHFTKGQGMPLTQSSIDDDAATALATGLHLNVNEKDLNISDKSVNCSEFITLISGIHCLTQLNVLDLSSNNIDNDDATALANELQHLVQLCQLNLSHNNIGPEGAGSLVIALHCLTELQLLDLSHNDIGPVGAISLANSLPHLPQLCLLDLSHNNIDFASAISLITASNNCLDMAQIILTTDRHEHKRGIHVQGLVSSDDNASIGELIAASRHPTQERELHLGFDSISVKPLTSV